MMAKGTFKNPFAPPKTKKPKTLTLPKSEKPAAPRRIEFERLLCEAIDKEKLVSLRYDGDLQVREFEPGIVFHSQKNREKINVSGWQIRNPNTHGEDMTPRNFEVGKIATLILTEKPFVVRERVDILDPKYKNGIICYFKKP